MLRARHRIMLIGWDFDGRTTMEQGETTLPAQSVGGALLYWLMWKRPDLEIHVLKSNLRLLPVFDDLWYGLTPVTVLNRLSGRRIRFAVDGRHPTGAVHHQKVVVIDDVLAFCGGIDLTLGRWDTSEHLDDSVFRRDYGPPGTRSPRRSTVRPRAGWVTLPGTDGRRPPVSPWTGWR